MTGVEADELAPTDELAGASAAASSSAIDGGRCGGEDTTSVVGTLLIGDCVSIMVASGVGDTLATCPTLVANCSTEPSCPGDDGTTRPSCTARGSGCNRCCCCEHLTCRPLVQPR